VINSENAKDTCGKPSSFTIITTKFNGNQQIKIVQWNCSSLRSKLPKFQQKSQNIDVIILSETQLDEAESVYLKGFDVVRKGRNKRAGGGVVIFINDKLKYLCKGGLYEGDGKIEARTIELYTGQDKILIVSRYKQPHMKIEQMLWKNFFAQFEGKFLTGGDFNRRRHS
jgi:exonuclease III